VRFDDVGEPAFERIASIDVLPAAYVRS